MKYLKLAIAFIWTIFGVLFFISGNWLAKHWPNEYSNCLIWALDRFNTEPGYMKVVHSRHSKLWPHFTFVDSAGEESELQPQQIPQRFLSKQSKWKRMLLPVLFKGKINKL